MILLIFFATFLTYVFIYVRQKFRMHKYDKLIPGPPALPIVGNGLEFINIGPVELYKRLKHYAQVYGDRYRVLLGPEYYIVVSNPEDCEAILTSPKVLEKSPDYYFFAEWLGGGLLISHGEKWHLRRKILTHAFHFRILDDFTRVFDSQGDVLVQQLAAKNNGPAFDIAPFITLYTLDVICETAMGIKLNAQINSDTEYVRNVVEISSILMWRIQHTFARSELFWKLSSQSKRHAYLVERIHNFTDEVISKRKEELLKSGDGDNNNHLNAAQVEDEDEAMYGTKKRYALLDLLLNTKTADGKPLSNLDIREEVDNFMFAGHDTTTATIEFLLYNLARFPDVQQKVFEEARRVFGDHQKERITTKKLNELKYLDLVLKETLRLFPAVPFIGRHASEDVVLNGKLYPAGSNISLGIGIMQLNPKYFKDPEQFIPERHDSLKMATEEKSSFAYIPFAAGFRNCIGQKFAQYEIKTIISKLMLNYEVELGDKTFEPILAPELIMKPFNGMWLKFKTRTY